MKLPALKELIDERKEKAIASLSENYAKNRLPLEEYERLVEYIHKTESERELVVVEKLVAEFSEEEEDDDEDTEDNRDYFPSGERHIDNKVSVLSARTFQGPLDTSSQYISVLGSTTIKIRKSDLSKKRSKLNVLVILGECDIMVENGIRVRNQAVPILGSTGVSKNLKQQDSGPELFISGTALLGDISVRLLKE
ncbi:MAG: cell wall-active antibiotics response protein [Treponema sp.]|nr:cell wall-active antibiotics response protein [Treponema sp.]